MSWRDRWEEKPRKSLCLCRKVMCIERSPTLRCCRMNAVTSLTCSLVRDLLNLWLGIGVIIKNNTIHNMNKTAAYMFTVIVPIYDEEDGIGRLASSLENFVRQSVVSSCVLFVNDGSKDGSLSLIKKVCEDQELFFYISFKENCGLSAAIKAGIDYAESQWVGYIDADLQTDPLDFNILLSYANEFPLVTGIRANRKDSHFKRIQSKIANRFRRLMTGDTATDTGCPLKVIQTEYAKRIPFFIGMHRFLPALIMLQQDGRFKEIPVHHYPRISGQSKFHLWNRLKGPFIDCFAYRWLKERVIRYQIKSQYI